MSDKACWILVSRAVGAALSVLLTACSGTPKSAPGNEPPSGDLAGCSRDAECTAVLWGSCCSCPNGVRAVNQSLWQKQMDLCAAKSCSVSVSCATVPENEGKPLPPAVCRAGRCELAPQASTGSR